ncbi:2OG-Fe(II) oxygenase [Luteimonas vadosa]|uniref:Fe2OG dioxygenase domain-containing protein n=1 Tax=Luteimonas vadosa TaxID=1165507 RepID=A0ABP9E5W8_9GAMM
MTASPGSGPRAQTPETSAAEAAFREADALLSAGDFDAGFAAYQRAAEGGHRRAQVELARMHLYGIVEGANPVAGVDWLSRAEAAGNPIAAYLMAMVALGGALAPRDQRINERLRLAIDEGLPPALRAAAIHFGRKPHPEDQALCIRLLERAAEGGDRVAACLLAERLANGEGTPAQPEAAEDLWRQLESQGVARLPAVSAGPPRQAGSTPRHLALEDVLSAPSSTVLSKQPRVAVVDGLLSADECRLLIATSQPMLRGSQTTDPDTGDAIAMPIRTSSDASLDPIQEDFALRAVQLRLCAAAGVDLVQAEHLTVLRYEPGQQYRPHRDYLPPATIARDGPQAGNRMRTICVYLNDVEAGGATEFPGPGVSIAPKAGSAVVFDNLLPDGSPDPDSVHAGLPVDRGVKWLGTLWLRQGRYRAF